MLSICVVEDEESCRRELCGYLERYARERGEHVHINAYADGDDLVQHYRPGCDIILLDIEMRLMNGLETARQIRRVDDAVTIIFVTNAPQYAMKGYEVNAFDYVLKPVDYDVFVQHLDRAMMALRKRRETGQHVAIAIQGGVRRVAVDSIRYVEVRDHTLIVHTTSGDIMTRGTMRDLEHELDASMFFRCHKMFLVNLDYVDGIQGSTVTIGSDKVLVSRARHKQLLDALNERMSGAGM